MLNNNAAHANGRQTKYKRNATQRHETRRRRERKTPNVIEYNEECTAHNEMSERKRASKRRDEETKGESKSKS